MAVSVLDAAHYRKVYIVSKCIVWCNTGSIAGLTWLVAQLLGQGLVKCDAAEALTNAIIVRQELDVAVSQGQNKCYPHHKKRASQSKKTTHMNDKTTRQHTAT